MAPPLLLIAGTGLTVLGLILEIVALATPHWANVSKSDSNFGLFKWCLVSNCVSYADIKAKLPGSFIAVQALVIMGLLLAMAECALTGLVFIFQYLKGSPKQFNRYALPAGITSAFLTITGCTIFNAKAARDFIPVDTNIGYSFALAAVGAVFEGGAGCLIYIAGNKLNLQLTSQRSP